MKVASWEPAAVMFQDVLKGSNVSLFVIRRITSSNRCGRVSLPGHGHRSRSVLDGSDLHARLHVLLVLSMHMAGAPGEVTRSVGRRIDRAGYYRAALLVSNAFQFGFYR